MALSNRDRIGKALDSLRDGLLTYLSDEFSQKIGIDWKNNLPKNKSNLLDITILLGLFIDYWGSLFKSIHPQSVRAYISEIIEARNKWAHSQPISSDDADRYLDTAIRLCKNINAKDQAEEIRLIREELQQQIFADRARHRSRYQSSIENSYKRGLQPWREVITPHRDVIDGKYLKAEFAANLDLVKRGASSSEYSDPEEFYRRTFITDGLKKLLTIALKRFNNKTDEPVIELQTNFGGGKTHSMLALYHLCSGISLDQLPGLDELCSQLGIYEIPKASKAVLVGTAFNPAKSDIKPDGTKVQTLWGEMAWQIGGKEAYEHIKENDLEKVPPGSIALASLLKKYGPCLILIDEWVAYARNLVSNSNLPAGTFDSQITFAHELTEAVQATSNALLLISVPQSRDEIGGNDGDIACNQLKNIISRIAFQWRPATRNEGFEIVRRRLFEPISTNEHGTSRDAVIKAFCDMYAVNKAEFPSDCREYKYKEMMSRAYPIHPELFKKLYEEWSTLDQFQKTRGVLRLLALTIETLWNGDSKDLLIMPSSIPVDDNDVKNELVKFLDNEWEPIISTDVDGAQSIPTNLDRQNPNFGRVSACKRVARSLYIGTAPGLDRQQKGIDDQAVKLGCVMPGEPIGVFGDALRRLGDKGKYIQQNRDRYWIDKSPNLNRTADEYKEGFLRNNDELISELNTLILEKAKKRGDFQGIHAGQNNNDDIPDKNETRLVMLSSKFAHRRGIKESKALDWVKSCIKNKGKSPRQFLNTLIFLAPNDRSLDDLLISLAEKRSWERIKNERLLLNLTANQENQTATKIEQASNTIDIKIAETWSHLLIPSQDVPGLNEPTFLEKQLSIGKGSIPERAYEKCIDEEFLYDNLGARIIKQKLDKYIWQEKNHILVGDFINWCSKYIYLPRVSSKNVIFNALINPNAALTGEKTFYLADSYDENLKKYNGLRPQFKNYDFPNEETLIVKTEIAEVQVRDIVDPIDPPVVDGGSNKPVIKEPTTEPDSGESQIKPELKPKHFKGSLKLDPTDASLKTSKFMSEVMSHLQALPGSEINITLDINVKNEDGIDKQTARIILENSITLKVDNPEIF